MTTRTPTDTSNSPHTSDPLLHPFIQPTFDPATYLNTTLPSLSTLSTRSAHGSSVPLTDLSQQTQALLNQLNAQTSRLSNTLTTLTDEIIRSGGRLAYEVEVLRGETSGLGDALEGELKTDILTLVPAKPTAGKEGEEEVQSNLQPAAEPEYLTDLRTLSLLRSRLEAVIQIFGSATAWPLSPSLTSNNFISVSAPTETAETRDREAAAQSFASNIRSELASLLSPATDTAGLEVAVMRVEEMRQLAEVWKGTAEEKARRGFVEGLEGLLEERRRVLARSGGREVPRRAADMRYGDLGGREGEGGGGGFLSGLRRMGDGLYIE